MKVKNSDNLRNFLKNELGSIYSVRKLKDSIDKGFVKVNGKIEKLSTRTLDIGDNVTVDLSCFTKTVQIEYESCREIYNDDDILVYNKPAYIATMNKGLLEVLQKKYCDLIPVHRLDVGTTGVMLFAHNKDAEKSLLQQFKDGSVNKIYRALVYGKMKKKYGEVDVYLKKERNEHGNIIMKTNDRKGLRALTTWRLITQGRHAMVECDLHTGRTHQIRVHMQSIGHPLIGDSIYNKISSGISRPMLHAYKIGFKHPSTGEQVSFKSNLPSDFKLCMEQFL